MTGLAEEMGKQFEEQQALISELEHQIERLRHFEQVHIDNLDHYREQIAAIETDNELYERAIEAAYDAGRNRDGTPPDEWTLGKAIDVVDAYLATAPQASDDWFDSVVNFLVEHEMLDARDSYDLNDVMVALRDNYTPQAPVSAVPAGDGSPLLEWAVSRWNSEVKNRPLRNVHRRSLDDTWRQVIRWAGGDPIALVGVAHDDLLGASPPPPAQADDGKDAEIGYLKIEMEGVENAKEEIGRLLGLTEEFRWKRISAAIHEQKRLIRELVTMIGQALADTERNPLETGFNHSSETTRELARGLILVRNGLFDAIAKAKEQGYEP